MKAITPTKVAVAGGLLISASGIVNVGLGMHIGALLYEVYPGGKLGHVGVVSGVIAIILGLLIVAAAIRQYRRKGRNAVIGGILTILFGHAGAVAGAIYVGTAGVILCYGAAIWLFASEWKNR